MILHSFSCTFHCQWSLWGIAVSWYLFTKLSAGTSAWEEHSSIDKCPAHIHTVKKKKSQQLSSTSTVWSDDENLLCGLRAFAQRHLRSGSDVQATSFYPVSRRLSIKQHIFFIAFLKFILPLASYFVRGRMTKLSKLKSLWNLKSFETHPKKSVYTKSPVILSWNSLWKQRATAVSL